MAKTKKKITRRTLFDKKKLAYKINKGTQKNPKWDYSVTAKVLKDNLAKERRNLTFRTIKLVLHEDTDTFADVLKLRFDWIVPDSEGKFGTEGSVELTLANARMKLDEIDEELPSLGFKPVGLKDRLNEEDRRTTSEKSLSTKLIELGLEPIEDSDGDQQTLF